MAPTEPVGIRLGSSSSSTVPQAPARAPVHEPVLAGTSGPSLINALGPWMSRLGYEYRELQMVLVKVLQADT